MSVVSNYTRESGVRQLERQIGAVARKVARKHRVGRRPAIVDDDDRRRGGARAARPAEGASGARRTRRTRSASRPACTTRRWAATSCSSRRRSAGCYGGSADRRRDDAGRRPGGAVSLILTGQLGDVMKESARAALTYATNTPSTLGIPKDRLGAIEAHIHVPAGAIPKDGPSAGVAIATALVSRDVGPPGAPRRRDDRRDHAARPRAADRRAEGEGARRAPRGDHHDHPAEGQRGGHRGHPGGGAQHSSPSTACPRWTRCSPSR